MLIKPKRLSLSFPRRAPTHIIQSLFRLSTTRTVDIMKGPAVNRLKSWPAPPPSKLLPA